MNKLWLALTSLVLPTNLLAQESSTGTSGNPVAGLLAGGVCMIFWIIAFIIWIILMIWIYKDAKARGQNAFLWLILTFFFFLIPVIVWLIIRPKEKVGEAPKPPEPPKPA